MVAFIAKQLFRAGTLYLLTNKQTLMTVARVLRPRPALLWGPGLGIFGAGLAVGAGVSFFASSKSGRENRAALTRSLNRWMGRDFRAGNIEEGRPEPTPGIGPA